MNLRVNLIKDTELRHPGTISTRTVVKISIISALVILSITALTIMGQRASVTRALEQTEINWQNVEPTFRQIQGMQERAIEILKYQKELDAWAHSGIDWVAPFEALPDVVLPAIQLRKLWVSSSVTKQEPDKTVRKSKSSKDPPPKEKPLIRQYALMIDGQVSGPKGEQVVVQFVRDLRTHEVFAAEFDDVRLQGLKSATGHRGEGENIRLFGVEALSKPQEFK